jgi:uncharacterized protein YndB with AHSA1/START domain
MTEPNATPAGDRVNVSVFVAVTPDVAFEVFTQEIDLWWKRGPKYRMGGSARGTLHLEPQLGGRLFESYELDAGSPRLREVGRVTAWDPPARLEFEWRAINFAPDEKTVVEVRFEPSRNGTMLRLQHRGFGALRDDHPVRHGRLGTAFGRMMGLWWGELMTSLREHVSDTRPEPETGSQ